MKKYDTLFLCIAICVFGMVLGVKVFSAWTSDARSIGKTVQENQALETNPYKVISSGRSFPNQPIQIMEVKVKGKYVALSRKFKEEEEWLKGISWKIRNVSNKEIIAIYADLQFPKTSSMEHTLNISMNYIANSKTENTDLKKPLKFNESAIFTLSDERYDKIKPLLESKMLLSDIKHVIIDVRLVVFNDDTAWGLGEEFYRDPNNPRRWIPIQ